MIYFFKWELKKISEYVADEFVIEKTGNSKQYANLLLKLKEKQMLLSQQQPVGYVQTFIGSTLKGRVNHLLNNNNYSPAYGFSVNIAIALLLLFSTYTVLPSVSRQVNSIHIYQTMFHINKESGQVYFCKSCITYKWQNRELVK